MFLQFFIKTKKNPRNQGGIGWKLKFFAIFFLKFLIFGEGIAQAETYYIAPPAGGAGGSGTIEDPWHDLNYALNRDTNDGIQSRVRPGDTLYLRGGVYDIRNMTRVNSGGGRIAPMVKLENTTNSSAPIIIKSYPNEWAILDGNKEVQVFQGNPGGRQYNIIFENFEVRNGYGVEGEGLIFGNAHDDVWLINSIFRNLYILNNGHTDPDANPAGMHLSCDGCIIENCTFLNNGRIDANGNFISDVSWNVSNLILYDNYDQIIGTTIDQYPRKNNIIRYNRFEGETVGIKSKGSGNYVNDMLGYDNALTDRHPEWYSEIYNNLFLDNTRGLFIWEDFLKIHHNIIVNPAVAGVMLWGGSSYIGPNPLFPWENKIYHNTIVGAPIAFSVPEWYTSPDYEIDHTYGGYNHEFYNNLVISPSTSVFSFFSFSSNFPTWPMVDDHNGVDSSTSKPFGIYTGINRTLQQWQAIINPRTETNTLGSDDLYQAFSVNSDYSLPIGSAAIDVGRNGTDLGAIQFGEESWINNIGYNQVEFGDIVPPANPSNLSVF